MYVHVLYNKIHLLKNLRMKQPVQVNPGLNCSFSYENCIYIYIYIYIYIQSIDLFHDSSRFLHQIFDFISHIHQGDCVASTVTYTVYTVSTYIYIYIWDGTPNELRACAPSIPPWHKPHNMLTECGQVRTTFT